MTHITLKTLTLALAFTATATAAQATAITEAGSYQLSNGEGRERGVTVFHEGERYNVDFENDGASVFLNYDGESTATITGQGYDDFLGELVDINFTYTDVQSDDELGLVAFNGTGSGTIGDLELSSVVSNRAGFAFAANVDSSGALKLDGWLDDGGDFHALAPSGSFTPVTAAIPGVTAPGGGGAGAGAGAATGGGSVPAPGGLLIIAVAAAAAAVRRKKS